MWKELLLLAALSAGVRGDVDEGKLNLITVAEEMIEGEYYSRNLGSIHFVSKSDSLSITTLGENEEKLFVGSRPSGPNSASVASILNSEFLLLNTPTEGIVDFSVSPSMSRKAKEAVESPNHKKLDRLLPKLSHETDEIRQSAYEQLVSRPEVELIIAAAKAMGDEGITGRKNPAALPFYVMALRLAKQQWESEVPSDPIRTKRRWWSSSRRYCDEEEETTGQERECHHGHTCRKCPQSAGNKCCGMCGKGCWCWSWVCGDCCWQQGCHGHDVCCDIHGFFSWSCLAVWNLRCNSSYEC